MLNRKNNYLVNFEVTYKGVEDPRENKFKRGDSKLVEMVAHFWFKHLKKIFEKFAKANDRLIVAGYSVQITEVLAVQSSEDKVTLLFLF